MLDVVKVADDGEGRLCVAARAEGPLQVADPEDKIGNDGSALTTNSQIRNGISSQTSMEGEQILNHFLNRLPIITLKEGSRARVYIGKDILIPSYADHRVNPTL